MARKKIGLIGFLHESNTFISELTTYEHFHSDFLLEGDAFLERMSGTHHETAGFISRLEEDAEEIEIVPLLFARAMPYGTICASAYEKITRRIIELLTAALPLDGLLLAPHGATVSQDYRDADGHWMSWADCSSVVFIGSKSALNSARCPSRKSASSVAQRSAKS